MFDAVDILPVIFLLLFVVLFIARRLIRKAATKSGPPLPPGPPRLPIVGNALGVDAAALWETSLEWGKAYGDIIYCRFFNQDVIIINSEKIARDLLDKRSYNYSDRPDFVTTELYGWTFNVGVLRYGENWRQHRRFLHDKLRSTVALAYRPLQMYKARQLLVDILETPNDFVHHLQTMTTSTIMSITYGYETQRRNDPLVAIFENALKQSLKVMTPRAIATLTALPFLLYLPSWFPGAGFKKRAHESCKMLTEMVEKPFEYATSHMDSDKATPCMVSGLLSQIKGKDNYDELEKVVKNVVSTSFVGASETTASTLINFILAMVLYPNVQKRAQEEIDSVVGQDRLPNFNDRDSLPYVEAVIRESHRWHPVLPVGIAHAAVNDDIYEGYHIPKGATIIPNIWAMTRNETKYHNPSEFKPERFFTTDDKLNDDKVLYAFGFGRRICVGHHVADAATWAAIVSLLAVFKFAKPLDEQGKEIDIEPRWTAEIAVRPVPFACHIQPRSPAITKEKLHQMIGHFA